MIVLLGAALVFAFGAIAGWPWRRRWVLAGGIIALAFVLNLILPEGHLIRRLTGDEAGPWGLILGFAGLGMLYARLLRHLRTRVVQAPPTSPPAPQLFSPGELGRYSRHIMLREIGGLGQRRLKEARVLVVGAGGLGAPVMLYLAAAGVGRLDVIDDDVVEESNLQRQVIHGTLSLGRPKAQSAAAAVAALNPHVQVTPITARLTAETAPALFAEYDLILDGTDNFATRHLVNDAAVVMGKPLIAGAMTQWEGQLSVWDPARGAPCYRCIFPEIPAPGLVPTCAEAGVLGPLPGVIGTMIAAEAVKLLTGAGDPLRGRLLLWDALYAEARIIAIARRADCQTCGHLHRAG